MKKNNFLLTGSSGFLGKIIFNVLTRSGNTVKDINDLFNGRVDITLPFQLNDSYNPDVIVHIAGKAHTIPKTNKELKEFNDVNVEGTKNLCNAISQLTNIPISFVFISSVSVYGLEAGVEISENDELLGSSSYAQSKIQAEVFLRRWGEENNISILILRVPLIAGPNPPGNLGKMIQAIKSGKYISINNGRAKRSAVLAEDIAYCILNNFDKNGTYNLTDDKNPSFREFESSISQQLGKKLPFSMPIFIGKLLGKIGDLFSLSFNSDTISKMSNDLTFSCEKAKKDLNWNPKSVIQYFRIN